MRRPTIWYTPFVISTLLAASAASAQPQATALADLKKPQNFAEATTRSQAMMQLGQDLFFEKALSSSGKMSCASCHDPDHAYTPANGRAVQLGGAKLDQPGNRAVPTLKYLQALRPFEQHHRGTQDDGEEGFDQGPAGGLTWDGRVDRGRDQARIPILSPIEMANRDEASAVGHILAASYGPRLKALFGEAALADPKTGFAALTEALEAFEQQQDAFFPFTSKFDYWLEGQAQLTEAEKRGFRVFLDPGRGNCASCHKAALRPNGGHPYLTNFGLVAAAVPRNAEIPANRDPNYFDLGACGPIRTDLAGHPEFCGLFKTPTLRNVALKNRFFHNGVAKSLRDAVRFYAERGTNPERWYPKNPDGSIAIYNDIPPQYRGNINHGPPFDRKPGERPRLNAGDIDDIVAFLNTLTDGYTPEKIAAAPKAEGNMNPYSPWYDHLYRHGAMPTRETMEKMRAWKLSRRPARRAPAASNLLAFGGGADGIGVTSGVPRVYLVFYGSQWATGGDPNGSSSFLQALFSGIGTGGETWSGTMTQYCDGPTVSIGATSCNPTTTPHVGYPGGGALAGVWFDTSVASPRSATKMQLAQEAIKAAAHFGSTAPTANRSAQYVIVSATGMHPDGFNTSGANFCGWHDYTPSPYGDVAYINLPYVSDAGKSCGANFVNPESAGVLDSFSIVSGHEYAETLTDQNP
ncbi:MAG TPA: cytochrome c peroxidase, partial [Rhizomicrobium sp.]|nr:cytochrome c peroxidase [Rhizomicrobium sp.]